MNVTPGARTVAVVAVVLLGAVLYWNSLQNQFVYNDYEMVVGNSFITSWKNLGTFLSEDYFLGSKEGTYRPLTTLTFFVDHALWGEKPFGYHLTNLTIHIFNGLLLYLMTALLSRRFSRAEGNNGTAQVALPGAMLPLLSALFFVSHPVAAEGVLSVGSRHEAVTTFFFLSSVCAYLGMEFVGRVLRRVLYFLSLATFFLSMLAIELGLMVPAVIFVIDAFLPEGGSGLKARIKGLASKIPLYAGFAVPAALYLYLRFVKVKHSVGWINNFFDPINLIGGSYPVNIATAFVILKKYILLLFAPFRLSLEYVVKPVTGVLSAEAALSFVIVAGIIAAAFAARKKHPFFFFGWAWFFITVFPVSNLVMPLVSTKMSERFIYLPAAGFCVFLAAVLCTFARLGDGAVYRRRAARGAFAAAAAILCFYSARTVARTFDWRDSLTFWETAAKTEDKSFRTHNNLAMQYYYGGNKEKAVEELAKSLRLVESAQTRVNLGFVYLEDGDLDSAEKEFRRAINDNPGYAPAYYHMALVARKRGNDDEAILLLETAEEKYQQLKERPFEAETLNLLGNMLYKKDMKERAIQEFKKALSVKPDLAEARYGLASIYVGTGAYDKAVEELKKVVVAEPGNVEAYMMLGYAYLKLGLDGEAVKAYSSAVSADPGDIKTRYILANLYLKMKMFNDAEREYLLILERDPSSADSMNNLGNIYYSKGMLNEAVEEYRRALEVSPSHFKARNNLANIYLMMNKFDMAVSEYKKVLEAQPGNPVVRYNLGLAYEGKGMLAEAVKEWEEALRIDPTFTPANEAIRRIRGNRI